MSDTLAEPRPVSSALAIFLRKNEDYYMFDDKVVIGRRTDSFICVPNPFISKEHCLITRIAHNKFTICDMSSLGTFINGKKLIKNKPQELFSLDTIGLVADDDEYSYLFIINDFDVSTPHTMVKTETASTSKDEFVMRHQIEKEELETIFDLSTPPTMVKTETASPSKYEMVMRHQIEKEELETIFDLSTPPTMVKTETASPSKYEMVMRHQIEKEEMETIFDLSTPPTMVKTETVSPSKDALVMRHQIEKEELESIFDLSTPPTMVKTETASPSKYELVMRHQIEKEELESMYKAEINDLKNKLKKSELQQQQFQELQIRFEETKEDVLECELKKRRIFEAKVEAEQKLMSQIQDLKREIDQKEEKIKALENKIKANEQKEERMKLDLEILEVHVVCGICTEPYVEPIASNCGHLFCKCCITEWIKKNQFCPTCCTKISDTVRVIITDPID